MSITAPTRPQHTVVDMRDRGAGQQVRGGGLVADPTAGTTDVDLLAKKQNARDPSKKDVMA